MVVNLEESLHARLAHTSRDGGYPWRPSWGHHGLGCHPAPIQPRPARGGAGFPPESSWDKIDKLVDDFTDVAEAVIAAVDVADIISNDPDGE
jgi:hypothetical protein